MATNLRDVEMYLANIWLRRMRTGIAIHPYTLFSSLLNKPPDGIDEQMAQEMSVIINNGYYQNILHFLLENEILIPSPTMKGDYLLSADGIKAKELGSIEKYFLWKKKKGFWDRSIVITTRTGGAILFLLAVLTYLAVSPPSCNSSKNTNLKDNSGKNKDAKNSVPINHNR